LALLRKPRIGEPWPRITDPEAETIIAEIHGAAL
jgi:hypothetical protein